MRSPFGILSFAAACGVFSSLALGAGAVHTVAPAAGTADFTTVAAAVAAAADGDVVLVKEGVYTNTVIDGKGITIVADDTADPSPHALHSLRIRNVPASSAVVVRGFELDRFVFDTLAFHAVQLDDDAGLVLFEDCEFVPTGSNISPLRVEDCERVVLTRCTLTGKDGGIFLTLPFFGQKAITAIGSNVSLYDCTVRGGDAADAISPPNEFGAAYPGPPAVEMSGGRLLVSGGTVEGGDGGAAAQNGANCVDGSEAGPAVLLLLGAELFVLDATLLPGAPGAAAGPCPGAGPTPPVSPPSAPITTWNESSRSIVASAVVRAGQFAVVKASGVPAEPLVLLMSPAGSALFTTGLQGTLVPTSPLQIFVGSVFLPGGIAQFGVILPPLPAGLEGVTVHLQTVGIGQPPLGVLSAPTAITLVQAGI